MNRERKLNRLSGYDYSQNGIYFVTICVQDREDCFGKIKDGKMILNQYGKIIENQWKWLFERYSYLKIDEYIVMPNHFHGLLHIVGNGRVDINNNHDDDVVGNGRDRSLRQRIKPLPQLIGAFKTTSSKLIHQSGNTHFRWQKSYWDRIVRNDNELNRIRQYIINNPIKWGTDHENNDGFEL